MDRFCQCNNVITVRDEVIICDDTLWLGYCFSFCLFLGGGFSILRNLFCILVLCAVPSADQQESVETEKVLSASPMMQVEGFFMALTNSNTDGRVVVHKQGAVLNTQHKIKNSYDINALQCKVHPLLVLQGLCRRAASSSFC